MPRLGILIRIAATLAVTASAGVFVACEDTGGPCVRGEACICTEDCDEACDGPGCGFECQDGANCSFSCPEGDCSVQCNNAASCDLDCAGGGCSMQCSGTNQCELLECDANCPLMCGGADECSNSCGIEAGCPTT